MYQLTHKKFLSKTEQEALTASLDRFWESDPRDTALIYTALYTGARASELLSVRASDLVNSSQSVFIAGLKSGYDREIPLPPWLFRRLSTLPVHQDGRLFPIGYARFREIWNWWRPVKKPLHCLRHTCALNIYSKTKEILLVKQVLGHKDIKNTMIYATYHYNGSEMRKLLLG